MLKRNVLRKMALLALAVTPGLLGGCPTAGDATADNANSNTNADTQNTATARDSIPPAPADGAGDAIPAAARTTGRVQQANMTYFIQSFSSQVTQERQEQLIADAFSRWSAVTPLNFTRTQTLAAADFVIGFGRGTHCELYTSRNLTCPTAAFESTTIGHAYFPNAAERGQCHMNEAFNFSDERLLFSTLVHEIGHNLGLEHIAPTDAVMFANDNGQTGALTQADIDAVQRVYGSRDGSVRPTAPLVPPSTDANVARTAPTTNLPDADGDGLDDATERFVLGTNPENADSDGDGLGDGVEVVAGLDAKNSDTDGDGVNDGDELNGDGNAFRPDFQNGGDVSALVGKYAGSDSNGSTLQFTIAADSSVTGSLSIKLYGFDEDVALLGAVNSSGRLELVSNDYFFEFGGTIAGTNASGAFSTDTKGTGTWTAARGAARLMNVGRGDFGKYRAQR